jgi:hypothetical protein
MAAGRPVPLPWALGPLVLALAVLGRAALFPPLIASQEELCAPTPLAMDQAVAGMLEPSDCRSLGWGEEYPADRYALSGTAGQAVVLTLSSEEFPVFLSLYDPDGNLLAESDQEREAFSTQLTVVLPAGGGMSLKCWPSARRGLGPTP